MINEIIQNSTADLLENDKNYIIAEWLHNVRSEINVSNNRTDAEIIDYLGSFLNNLISALRTLHASSLIKENREISKQHALKRTQFAEYNLDQLIQEYHILRKTIFDYLILEGNVIPTEEDRSIVHDFIDNGIQSAASEFVKIQTESKKFYTLQNSLLNSTTEYIWLIDRDYRYTYVNQALADLWKLAPSEIVGKIIFDMIEDPSISQKVKEDVTMAFTGKRVTGELVYAFSEGDKRYYQHIVSPVFDKNGKINAVAGILHDISIQKKIQIQLVEKKEKLNASRVELEKALKSRDESLRTLSIINRVGQNLTSKLEISKIVQSVTDAATEITGALFGAFFYMGRDEKGNKILHYTFSGLAKKMYCDPPCSKLTEDFHPTFAGLGTIRSDDITIDSRFGENLSYYGLPENDNTIKSYLGVSVVSRSGELLGGLFLGHKDAGVFTKQDEEIVEGLAAQAAIAMENGKLYQKLQDSLKDRDTFLSIASHELKTPLTSLTLQSQMRKRQLAKGNLQAFDQKNLEAMFEADVKQLAGLNRLIDDMLDISRIRTGRLELNIESFDLCALAHNVVERFRAQLEEACEKITFESSEAVYIEADPYRIEQVITNLLTNAMKYGQGKPLEIKVFSDHQKEKGFLCVSDNGMGISEKDQERIFSRFERAISPNEVSGLGLGLAIVKDIVEAHGGDIHLDSEVGVGSTFTIAFKLARKH